MMVLRSAWAGIRSNRRAPRPQAESGKGGRLVPVGNLRLGECAGGWLVNPTAAESGAVSASAELAAWVEYGRPPRNTARDAKRGINTSPRTDSLGDRCL